MGWVFLWPYGASCIYSWKYQPACFAPWWHYMGFKSITEAYGLLRDIRSSEFLVTFHVRRFFAFTKDIAQLMQGSSMNVLTAYKSTDEARQCSQAAWDAAEKCSASIYQDITDSANTIGAGEVTVPLSLCIAATSFKSPLFIARGVLVAVHI